MSFTGVVASLGSWGSTLSPPLIPLCCCALSLGLEPQSPGAQRTPDSSLVPKSSCPLLPLPCPGQQPGPAFTVTTPSGALGSSPSPSQAASSVVPLTTNPSLSALTLAVCPKLHNLDLSLW